MAKKNQVVELKGADINNPYKSAAVVKEDNESSIIASESQRSMIEVMTKYEIAKRFPRDMEAAADKILSECSRPTLAELAIYSYVKGGQTIEGPTIRLMEAIARACGNIDFGWIVLSSNQQKSTIRAYAIDIESNVNRSTTFDVKHWRDTKSGGYPLKDEREIYELCANMSMRRVRSCIEGLVPRDVIEMALNKCEETSKASADTSKEGIEKLLKAFATFNVNKKMIEARLQGMKIEAMKAPQIVGLRKIYASLKEGIGKVEDFFDVALADKPKTEKQEQPDLKKEIKKEVEKAEDNKPEESAETPKEESAKPQEDDDTFPGDRPFPKTLV